MQMMAFFYFITFNEKTKQGGFWTDGFYPLSEAHHGDWGNSLHKAFMKAVAGWEARWLGITADGFFKSIIRKHPNTACWSWAVEWNENYRVVGFFGLRYASQEIVDNFQLPQMTTITADENSYICFRNDVKLSEQDDLLFVWNGENS